MTVHTLPAIAVPGGPELILVLLLAVLLFGSSRILSAARAVGESLSEFKKGVEQSKEELEELRNDEVNGGS